MTLSGLFLESPDDDGEPDPGPDPPVPTRPVQPQPTRTYDQTITRTYRIRLKARLENLGNCAKIFPGATAATLDEVANQIQFFNGSSGVQGSNRTQQMVSNNGDSTTLAATVAGTITASTLTDSQLNALPDIVLGTDFFNDPTVSAPNVLLHEFLHYALDLGDPGLYSYLSQFGFVYQQNVGSDQITQWLAQNCPPAGGK
jgi:hypothetical protein